MTTTFLLRTDSPDHGYTRRSYERLEISREGASLNGRSISHRVAGATLARWVRYCETCPDQTIVRSTPEGAWVALEVSL
jgi:hypothetical protein